MLVVGGVHCWGANYQAQLGVGHTNNLGDAPGELPPPPTRLYAPLDEVCLAPPGSYIDSYLTHLDMP